MKGKILSTTVAVFRDERVKDCLLHCVADMDRGDVGKMDELGITESFQVKRQVLVSGAEAAEMIIRVDNIIRSAPRQRPRDDRYH